MDSDQIAVAEFDTNAEKQGVKKPIIEQLVEQTEEVP